MTFDTSYHPPDTSEAPLQLTIGDLLRRAAREAPDQVALVEGIEDRDARRRYTYSELLESAEAGAHDLLTRFQPGEYVAIMAPNMPEWTVAQLSAALAGLVLVTVNPVLGASEVRYILEQSGAVGVIASAEYRGQNLLEMVERLAGELPELREVMQIQPWVAGLDPDGDDASELPDLDPQDHVMIQYTSGTTGLPKGAVLRHFGLVNSGAVIAERLQRGREDVWLNPLPMFHTGGCVMGTLGSMASLGTQVVVSDFVPPVVLQLAEEERATYLLAVPTMILALMESPDFESRDLSTLEVVSSGATTVAPELVRQIEAKMDVTYNMCMGQTESSSVIFMTPLDATTVRKAETLGIPLRHWETKIADPDGNPVPVGTTGEICCRGFGVMAGYHDMAEATSEAIDADGWLHTGDLGTMDADGYARITGRIKDIIIRGGENIFPREIEDLLVTHDAVADAAVIGVPDERWGELPVAFVRLSGDTEPTHDELAAFVGAELAHHKVPRDWVVVDAFPINAAGKVQKFVLRERYEALDRGSTD
ncbi:MAG: AMP-binding protein [Microthrixaceae bacterium]